MTRKQIVAFNFKRIRKSLGWTQAQAAEKYGCSVGYVGRIESAKVDSFGTTAMEKWALLFNVDRSEFLKREDDILDEEMVRVVERMKKHPEIREALDKISQTLVAPYEDRIGDLQKNNTAPAKRGAAVRHRRTA